MTRLSDSTQGVKDDVSIYLSFAVDEQGLTVLYGKATANVELQCQRCNDNFEHGLEVEFCYSPLGRRAQAKDFPEAYEPVDVDENGEIDLYQLIEDELILALPQVAMHDEADCNVAAQDLVFGEIPLADERPNPFAVLESLKNK